MQATARIFFQTSPAKRTKDDLCPVKLCITHKRVRKYYSIRELIHNDKWLFLSEDDIIKIRDGKKCRGKYKDIALEYERIETLAKSIINSIPVYSFGQFEEKAFDHSGSWDNIFAALIDHIKNLRSENRFGYASSFESTLRAIKEFHEKSRFEFNSRLKVEARHQTYLSGKPLRFIDITPKWLIKFDTWLENKGKSKSTRGIYIRNIRVLFNIAINEHGVNAEYPFNKFRPGESEGRKIALSAHQISLIASFDPADQIMEFHRDIFIFSFLANGMNLSDILRLKYSNIYGNEIRFVRQKTKNKHREEQISVALTPRLQSIIDNHGNKAIGYDAYVFPVLTPQKDKEKQYAEIKQFTKMLNRSLRKIAKKVGIRENVTSYTARHSWATIAKNSGTSTEYIKEALGHSSVSVTEKYLKSFESSTRQEHALKMEKSVFGN